MFSDALRELMAERGVSQTALGEAVGRGQQTVGTWCVGKATPKPDVVFAIEAALKVEPGTLSRHLGYYPPAAIPRPMSVRKAVMQDGLLDRRGRRVVLATYKAWLAGR